LVEEVLEAYRIMVCNMSLKMHFLHSHLDSFPINLGDIGDEHGKGFIMTFLPRRIADSGNGISLCWQLKRKAPYTYKRKSQGKRF
jgi:hypothetical protein